MMLTWSETQVQLGALQEAASAQHVGDVGPHGAFHAVVLHFRPQCRNQFIRRPVHLRRMVAVASGTGSMCANSVSSGAPSSAASMVRRMRAKVPPHISNSERSLRGYAAAPP
jgi:hypothetical protein